MKFQPKSHSDIVMDAWDALKLFRPGKNAESKTKLLLIFLSVLFTPLTLIGILWGYAKGYNLYMRRKEYSPALYNIPPAVRNAMIIGGIVVWLILFGIIFSLTIFFKVFFSEQFLHSPAPFILTGFNLVITWIVFFFFNRWRKRVYEGLQANSRYGTARFARFEELEDLRDHKGIYIGGNDYSYSKQGHFITVCKTRGGKGTNLIIPNLLGKGGYEGSTIVLDIKAENIAITERYQRSIGKTVLALDPWGLHTKEGATFNPLDLLSSDPSNDHLSDDADSMAEMILPIDSQSKDPFFNDRARALIAGLIMHIAISQEKEKRTLTTLWKWLRSSSEEWDVLLTEMVASKSPIVEAVAKETENILDTTPKTFSSILSSALQFTDFLKSAPLQRSLEASNFNINELSNGKITLYVVIPADLVVTKAQWLRLVIVSSLRAVTRNRDKRVTFILDEFSSLGFIREIETAINTLSGYNISIWPILTSLTALKNHYPQSWENFLSNAAVRQFTGIGDNFTAEYVSNLLGDSTVVSVEGTVADPKFQSTARKLLTPDEVRRGSDNHIFTFIEQRPPIDFVKVAYFEMAELEGRYDSNPYFEGNTMSEETTGQEQEQPK